MSHIPEAPFKGAFCFDGIDVAIRCYVLEDGTRLLHADDAAKAFGLRGVDDFLKVLNHPDIYGQLQDDLFGPPSADTVIFRETGSDTEIIGLPAASLADLSLAILKADALDCLGVEWFDRVGRSQRIAERLLAEAMKALGLR